MDVDRPVPIVLVKSWKAAHWNTKTLLNNFPKSDELLPEGPFIFYKVWGAGAVRFAEGHGRHPKTIMEKRRDEVMTVTTCCESTSFPVTFPGLEKSLGTRLVVNGLELPWNGSGRLVLFDPESVALFVDKFIVISKFGVDYRQLLDKENERSRKGKGK